MNSAGSRPMAGVCGDRSAHSGYIKRGEFIVYLSDYWYHKFEALLATVEDTLVNFRPCDFSIEIESLRLRKAYGFDGIPNEYLRHLSRKPLVHLTHLFNHCMRLGQFPATWKDAKIITLPKPGKYPKFPKTNILSASFLLWANYLRSWF
jgi:hypothetical protein